MNREFGAAVKISLLVVVPLLAGCGGTDSREMPGSATQGNSATDTNSEVPAIDGSAVPGSAGGDATGNQNNNVLSHSEQAEVSRFLGQTTFGPRLEEINALSPADFVGWLDTQFQLPVTSMRDAFDQEQQDNPTQAPNRDWLFEAFWRQAVTSEDQLRQRVAFALSQIFVISLRDGGVASSPRGAGDFYSRLAQHAFGNFRTLLEEVTLHPMMGLYLAHLGNQKGDTASGRVPDENFSREVMQLFSIGLYELNPDGSLKLSEAGEPIETYKTSDVQGLARVMTGFSWNGPDKSLGRFQGWIPAPKRDVELMQSYPEHHSLLEKSFLDTVIPATTTSDPDGDLKIALDALFNHPNVGSFIGKQLIQRLVSSNPSAEYIQRVSSVFDDNGQGVRGDMQAVIKAIILDPEARDMSLVSKNTSGRVREPLLRFAHWMRSFNAISVSGRYKILGTDDPATGLSMTVLRSPSVFNFYRPGYVPPGTPIAENGLVAPEMQITHETSVAGYLNSMLSTVTLGGGFDFDIRSDFPETVLLADDPEALVDRVDLLLLHGSMSDSLREKVVQAVNLVPLAEDGGAAVGVSAEGALRRAQIACYLALASPEYLVQK